MKTQLMPGVIVALALASLARGQVGYAINANINSGSSSHSFTGNGGYSWGTSSVSSGSGLPNGTYLSVSAFSVGPSSSTATCNISNSWQIVVTLVGNQDQTPTGQLDYQLTVADSSTVQGINRQTGGSCDAAAATLLTTYSESVELGPFGPSTDNNSSLYGGNTTMSWAWNATTSRWVGTYTVVSDSPATDSDLNHPVKSGKDDGGAGQGTTQCTWYSAPSNTFVY